MKKTEILKEKANLFSRNVKTLKKEKNGITLIALIITIIVLLILAGISIMMIAGDNSILKRATNAKEETMAKGTTEQIKLAVIDIVAEKLANNDKSDIKKLELEETLRNKFLEEDIVVSDRRPSEEYKYIVTVGKNKYGIKSNNEVELVKPGILNQYIEVTEVTEVTPTYIFENTITQEDVDAEVNLNNSAYSIIGIATSIGGEYVSTGTLEGNSGYLSIIDLQKAKFEYTLNNFFCGDEDFFVKVKINDDIEKIQKLTIVQGDVVKYEENFAGIEYKGTWNEMESEICIDGKAKYSETTSDDVLFTCLGSGIIFGTIANSDSGKINGMVRESETNSLVKLRLYDFYKSSGIAYVKSTEIEDTSSTVKLSSFGKTLKVSVTLRNAKHDMDGPDCKMIIDAIWVIK